MLRLIFLAAIFFLTINFYEIMILLGYVFLDVV